MISYSPKLYLSNFLNKLKSTISPARYPAIHNTNGVNESAYSKRALLIYITKPFISRDDDTGHQNRRQSKQLVKLLDEYGLIVDVMDINDMKFRPDKDYDLVIGNRVIDTPIRNHPVRIYLATTLHHTTHNENLKRRHERLYKRRKSKVEMRRIYGENMPYVNKSNAIIGFGNEFVMSSWRDAFDVPVYPINNYGYEETEFIFDTKDFSTARKHFLFFASRSQVQKGLDLLLEIFPKHPELHLYICSDFERELDFCSCYQKEIYDTTNIHPVGRIRVNGPEYRGLIMKCAYVIAPSCSEGQSGSVVQCMYSGLIPLVTKEVGIDTEDFGITFADDSLEEIERVVLQVSELPESWHREHSIRTRKISEEKYNEDAFIERWRSILDEILVEVRIKL